MKFSLIILLITFNTVLYCQCPSHDIVLRSQNEIDSFKLNFPECKKIIEGLIIINSIGGIYNLDSLESIEYVGGTLQIGPNPELSSINGLQNLTEVDGFFNIIQNEILFDYSHLKNIQRMKTLTIDKVSNSAIFNFNHIDSLGSLRIVNTQDTLYVNGLENLQWVGQFILTGDINISNLVNLSSVNQLAIFNNNAFRDFTQLSKIEIDSIPILSVKGSQSFSTEGINNIEVIDWLVLSEIESLSLKEINSTEIDRLGITECLEISYIDDLNMSSLSEIGLHNNGDLKKLGNSIYLPNLKVLSLNDHSSLEDISSLDFPSTNFEKLIIQDNQILSECSIDPICQVIKDTNAEVLIEGNNERCESKEQVLEYCTTTSSYSQEANTLNIWPNPVTNYLNINISCDYNYRLLDINGETVLSGYSRKETFDVSYLPKGFYYLSVSNNSISKTFKIVKQ